jgi:hypothetical protein
MSYYSFAILLVVLVSIAYAGQKVCPGYRFMRPPTPSCNSTCSMENDECPSDKKCCFSVREPCGFHCIVPKDNEPKKGTCPSPSAEIKYPYWRVCDAHFCDVDNDCKGAQKCCWNTCGSSVCVPAQ